MISIFKIFFGNKKVKVYKNKKKVKRKSLNYSKYKNVASILTNERLEYFNQFYNYKWGRVTIRNQKTRWGSCSKSGNLNFNYKIVLLTPKQADYIIVHELCHLKEFNHSQRFWDLVGNTIPDYKEVRSSLKTDGLRLR